MKKKLLIASVLTALVLWFSGSWLDGLSSKAQQDADSNIAKWKEQVEFLKNTPSEEQAGYTKTEVLYAECNRHLFNFMTFLNSGSAEQAGEERDLSSKSCQKAYDLMQKQTQSKNESERFHALYALGNLNVRLAMLALSKEEQTAALKEAVDSYISALQIKDDYQTKFNLELLISINKNARDAADQKLSPDKFKLTPKPSAAPGRDGKSKL
ncbi:hypothetical protein A2924_03710 [Candidatus Giovannonibacteria bacterium RIFCSPLOWO2_01_FULL_44_16]|uniref:DUF5667 domain-containing protein n=1 Tax=Candidatus Giovannonibacteria bacterium RIFCSPLOWO2_01_FULL_44_16 TaxID=1798348 RepID=A0A1F5X389_9BACT|nr:MAG: hypothetical protein A2924_03710 [Candidatus Giovannonibacteria bacterium RIFCSPLOWO2_01_FULL_44_16]